MRVRLAHDESGVTLVLALVTMLVLSTLAASLLIVVAVSHRNSYNVMNSRHAFAIAQTGLAYAEGNLYGAAAAHNSLVCDGTQDESTTPCIHTNADVASFSSDGGTGTFYSVVDGDGHTWTMFGSGTYNGVTKRVHAQADVPSPVTVTNSGVWNYLYADSTSGSCPTLIGGSTTVSVPVLTRGNLCIQAQFSGAQLQVGGNLTVSGGKGRVGTSTSKVPNMSVAGTCNGVTAGTGACDGSHNPIYATNATTSLAVDPQMPPVDLSNAYSTANPGPGTGHGCQTGSGAPTSLFDNNTSLDHSDGTIDLFPASPYDCVNGANEIRWCPTVSATYNCTAANTLYVNGTFFFDGNLSLSGNTSIVYSGQGTLYFSGGVTTAGGFSFCGISGCTPAWDPDSAGIVLVAGCWNNSTGSSLVSLATTGSYCVDYGGNSVLQVGTYCATDYHVAGTATNMGPVLADTLSLNGNMSTLVPFHIMPPGTPLNTSTNYLPASAPTYWSG